MRIFFFTRVWVIFNFWPNGSDYLKLLSWLYTIRINFMNDVGNPNPIIETGTVSVHLRGGRNSASGCTRFRIEVRFWLHFPDSAINCWFLLHVGDSRWFWLHFVDFGFNWLILVDSALIYWFLPILASKLILFLILQQHKLSLEVPLENFTKGIFTYSFFTGFSGCGFRTYSNMRWVIRNIVFKTIINLGCLFVYINHYGLRYRIKEKIIHQNSVKTCLLFNTNRHGLVTEDTRYTTEPKNPCTWVKTVLTWCYIKWSTSCAIVSQISAGMLRVMFWKQGGGTLHT